MVRKGMRSWLLFAAGECATPAYLRGDRILMSRQQPDRPHVNASEG